MANPKFILLLNLWDFRAFQRGIKDNLFVKKDFREISIYFVQLQWLTFENQQRPVYLEKWHIYEKHGKS